MLTTNNEKIDLVDRLLQEKKITLKEAFVLLNDEYHVPGLLVYPNWKWEWPYYQPPIVTCGEGGINSGGAVSLTNTDKTEFTN